MPEELDPIDPDNSLGSGPPDRIIGLKRLSKDALNPSDIATHKPQSDDNTDAVINAPLTPAVKMPRASGEQRERDDDTVLHGGNPSGFRKINYSHPPVIDAMTEARINGYDWGEIHSFMDGKRQEAEDAGYDDHEIDAFLGYNAPDFNGVRGAAARNLTLAGAYQGMRGVGEGSWRAQQEGHQPYTDEFFDYGQRGMNKLPSEEMVPPSQWGGSPPWGEDEKIPDDDLQGEA